MKEKVLPTPGSLSSQIWPPINSTSRRLMVRPSPVPPCLRVVDMSACEKGWNNFAACSRVMPMPVSRTENLSCTFSPVLSKPGRCRSRISPRSVNLTALLTKLVRIWPRRSGSPSSVSGMAGRHMGQELQALLVRLLRGERGDRTDDLVEPEIGGLEVELAGLDLREIEDVVDDGEQRGAGVVDLADVVALFRVERGFEGEVGEADDGVHRRADLVAHVGQEHGLHLRGFLGLGLRLTEFPGDALLFADIHQESDEPAGLTGAEPEPVHRVERDVGLAVGVLDRQLVAAASRFADDRQVLLVEAAALLLGQVVELQDSLADQEIAAGAKRPLVGLVAADEPASRVLDEHRVGNRLEQRFLEGEAIGQFLRGPLALGDVREADHRAHDGAVLPHGRGAVLHRQGAAVLAPQTLDVDPAGFAPPVGGEHRGFLHRKLAAIGMVMMDQGVRRLADHLLRREAEQAAGGGIHEPDPPLGVHAEDALGAGFQNQPGALLAGLEMFALGGQFPLLPQQLLLRLGKLLGLRLELPGLFLGLRQQFPGAQIALENFQTHRHDRQQLVHQRLLVRSQRPERPKLDHTQQDVPGHQRPGRHLNRRGVPQTGGNAAKVCRQGRQGDRPAVAGALADQSLLRLDRLPDRRLPAQASGCPR